MVKRYLWRYPKEKRTTLIGPNCAGIISPGKAMLGIMPGHIYKRGTVGLVTRSGTLGYEAASQMKALGIGITTSVGIGGDPINGSSFVDILQLFEEDPETEAVMMIGEIGGPQEAEAALFAKENMRKPVIGYVAGLTAPKGRRMGHAGAIISRLRRQRGGEGRDHAEAGLTVVPSPAELGATVAAVLGGLSKRVAVAHVSAAAGRGRDPPAARAGASRRSRASSTRGSTPTTVRSRADGLREALAQRRRPAHHRHRQGDRRGARAPSRGGPRWWPTSASASTTSTSRPPRPAGIAVSQHARRAHRRHRRPRHDAAAHGGAAHRRRASATCGAGSGPAGGRPTCWAPRSPGRRSAWSAWAGSRARWRSGRTTASA